MINIIINSHNYKFARSDTCRSVRINKLHQKFALVRVNDLHYSHFLARLSVDVDIEIISLYTAVNLIGQQLFAVG